MPRGTSRSKAKGADAEKENVVAASDEIPMIAAASDGIKEVGMAKAVPNRKPSLASELEEMTKKMNMISLEKEKAESLLKDREAQLKQKNDEEQRLQGLLETKDLEQKKLEEKLRKLQKVKEFHPSIELSMDAVPRSKDSKRDPNHIKRPLTPFMLWAKEQRVEVKKTHPDGTFGFISKLLGEKWKAVPDEEKKPYEDRYQVEKEVYLKIVGKEKREVEALKIFQEEHNKKIGVELLEQYLQFKSEKEDNGRKTKKEKDPKKPKKPISAFFVFSNERRPKLLADSMKIPEIGKRLGEEWKSLDENLREPYEKIATEDKARYAAELEAYKLSKSAEREKAEEHSKEQTLIRKAQGMQLLKQREQVDQAKKTLKEEKLKKKRVKAESVDPNKPKKPLTSYILFVTENRKSIQQAKPGASFADVTASLAVKWQDLTEAQKQIWVDKATAAREAYKIAMLDYNQQMTKKESAGSQVI